MTRQRVSSSNIDSIGYDKVNKILEVEFRNNSIYHYFGVPEFVFVELMNASSHGSYLAQHVKGYYRYMRIC